VKFYIIIGLKFNSKFILKFDYHLGDKIQKNFKCNLTNFGSRKRFKISSVTNRMHPKIIAWYILEKRLLLKKVVIIKRIVLKKIGFKWYKVWYAFIEYVCFLFLLFTTNNYNRY
jgi:hypothetical protein